MSLILKSPERQLLTNSGTLAIFFHSYLGLLIQVKLFDWLTIIKFYVVFSILLIKKPVPLVWMNNVGLLCYVI